jgi:protease I
MPAHQARREAQAFTEKHIKEYAVPALDNLRVAVIATDGVEEPELAEPIKALRDAGARTELLSLRPGQIQAVRHDLQPTQKFTVDTAVDQADPGDYDALLLPGGAVNADRLRMEPAVQSFIKQMNNAGKPMAVICHAPWELVSAGLARGRTVTSYHTIQDDLRNAGATWVDREVVVDGTLVTSRQPSDIPAFNREMLNLFAAARP